MLGPYSAYIFTTTSLIFKVDLYLCCYVGEACVKVDLG